MTSSTKIWLLRHGETTWNTEGRLQGQKNSDLTALGQQQAHNNGVKLRSVISGQPQIISSPLGRCRQTSELVAKAIDYDFSKIVFDDRVKEISFGRWEGQTKDEIKACDAALYQSRDENRWDNSAPDGESYSMVAERLQAWLSEVGGQNIILVSHGCAGRILRCVYAGIARDLVDTLDASHDTIHLLENGTVTPVV